MENDLKPPLRGQVQSFKAFLKGLNVLNNYLSSILLVLQTQSFPKLTLDLQYLYLKRT